MTAWTSADPTLDNPQTRRLVVLGGCLAFLVLLIRTAWMDDDAYITLRTVDNFLNGYGLRWNVGNRVQAYTHPLWMFTLIPSAAVAGEVYYSSLALSIAISVAAVALVGSRIAVSGRAAVFAFSGLALSKAFVDYSTSGLENPLTHLLLAGFFVTQASMLSNRGPLLVLSLLTALLLLNRVDVGLLVLPAFAVEVWKVGLRRAWRPVVLGMIPLMAWEAFSLIYYGFLVPNTAYSKLSHGVPRPEILYQGFLYLLDSMGNDPLTLLLIAAAVLSAFFGVGGWTVPGGIVLYLAYIVWVGGDFMSGRFLTAPLLAAVIHLVRQPVFRSSDSWALAMSLVWITGLTTPRPTIFSNGAFGADVEPARTIQATGITDERRYYYQQSGLLTARRGVPMPNHKWLQMGHEARARDDRVLTTDAAGYIGYAAGPGVYFVDDYGLGDALIARLPAEAPWRIGHFERRIPDGYLETLATGRNVIRDPAVGAYYEKLKIITEWPLWSRERLQTILRMHLGRYEHFIESYGLVRTTLAGVFADKPDGTAWNASGNIQMTLRGVEIALPAEHSARGLELSVSRNDQYRLLLRRQSATVYEHRIRQDMSGDGSMRTHRVHLPPDIVFDAVAVKPSGGDGRYALGSLKVRP